MNRQKMRDTNDSLTFWMLVLGAIAVLMSGADMAQQWTYLVVGARFADALIFVSGALLLAAALRRRLKRGRAASWLAAASAALFVLTMGTGILSGAIPCSGVG